MLLAVLALGVCWSALLLGARSVFLLDADAHGGDPMFYFTVGRGILNGLVPYADIFDPKPPGVFLLAAASFALFGSPLLGNLLSIAVLALYPLLLGAWSWRIAHRSEDRMHRIFLAATGVIGGAGLALWNSLQAGVWQPESFGNAFALLYVLAIISWREHMTPVRMALVAALIFGAIGCKEPYLFTLLAAALVVDARPRMLLRTFVAPLIAALIAGALVLWLLGWLDPYVSLYLPAVAGVRIQFDIPVWMRGFYVWEVAAPLTKVSLMAFPLFIALPLTVVALAARRSRTAAVRAAVAALIAAYLSVGAVGLAGNFPTLTYSASLGPYFIATLAVLLWELRAASGEAGRRMLMILAAAMLLLALSMPPHRVHPGVALQERVTLRVLRQRAAALDRLLDACAIDRYLYAVNPPQPLLPAFTRASPLNHFPYREIDKTPFGLPFVEKTLAGLSDSRIILVNPDGFIATTELGNTMGAFMMEHFTTMPYACAEPFMPLDGYMLLFRSGSGRISLGEEGVQPPEFGG